MNKFGHLVLGTCLIALLISCKRDDLDFDKLSHQIGIEREISMPLVYGDITANYFADNLDSTIVIAIDDSVLFMFDTDSVITYSDTLKISDNEEDTDTTSFKIEYAILHYQFVNYFSIGIDLELILFDSIAGVNIDTIKLNPDGGLLINSAPVDENGNVIESQVVPQIGTVEINASTANKLLNETSHIIFSIKLISVNSVLVSFIRLPDDTKLSFKFGIEAKGTYNSKF
jgi:hypothetical protein